MSASDVLHQVSLFADLREDESAALAHCFGRRVFAKHMILFHRGSPAQSLYLIESGHVRIAALSDSGHEITLDVYGLGECFGEMALLDGNLRSTDAIALESTVTYTLQRDDFLRCLEKHPQVARRVIELLVLRLERATARIENLVFLDVAGRVAAALWEFAARQGTDDSSIEIDLYLTQGELASWAFTSREMVNKVLHAYQNQGLIEVKGHAIKILDFGGLMSKIGH